MDDGAMDTAATAGADKASGSGPTGVLIIRAWIEGPAAAPVVRARLSGRLNVEDETTETMAASSIDEVLDRTRLWLETFVKADSPT